MELRNVISRCLREGGSGTWAFVFAGPNSTGPVSDVALILFENVTTIKEHFDLNVLSIIVHFT